MGCATLRHECAVDCSTFIPSIHVVMNIFLFAKGREGYTLWGLCATTPSKVASTTKHPGPFSRTAPGQGQTGRPLLPIAHITPTLSLSHPHHPYPPPLTRTCPPTPRPQVYTFVDAAGVGNEARYVNDARGSTFEPNAQLSTNYPSPAHTHTPASEPSLRIMFLGGTWGGGAGLTPLVAGGGWRLPFPADRSPAPIAS